MRGWLGVQIGELTKDIAEGLGLEGVEGVLINDVFEDSPAAKSGIEAGDVVLEIDGETVRAPEDLQFKVANKSVGSTVEIVINRSGKIKDVKVELGERPTDIASLTSQAAPRTWLGIDVVEIDSPEARQAGVEGDQGVVIWRIENNSPAAEAGLAQGEIILRVGREDVQSVSHYNELVEEAKESGKPVVLLVKGQRGTRFVPIKTEEE